MLKKIKSSKIIEFNNLKSIKKKQKKIIHCHGVFDLVHPGHIRHFFHCKEKADILVVSLTPDKFIEKGLYRPLVPQQLRAINLAALEIVDYVIIDRNKTPIELINILKPSYFAKGVEYRDLKNPLTILEKKAVEKNGGKIIFSPGDYVMSSTKIIEQITPDLSLDKLKILMDADNLTFQKLRNILESFKKISVNVIGDTIVDINHYCEVVGGLHKTPTLSVSKKISEKYLGGASIVAAHFKEITNNVTLTTLLGRDKYASFIKNELRKRNISLNYITEENRPTTTKSSYICNFHKLLKVDNVINSIISIESLEKLQKKIKKTDIIVFSDFRHGMFNSYTINKICKKLPKKIFKVADSQVASRWGNICDFKNFDLITPTEKEARFSLMQQDDPIRTLINNVLDATGSSNVILKLGSKGIISLNKKKKDYITIDSFVNKVLDNNGAGDCLLAYSSLTLFKTKSLIAASIIGVLAASCKCEMLGNKPVKIEDLLKKINEVEKSMLYLK